MKSPAFRFYADDFVGGTVDMTPAEVGSYIRLLCYQWNRGSTPVDSPEKLAIIAGCVVSDAVIAKFPGGKNQRLEAERQKQADYRALQADKGKKSAEARFNRGSTAVQPDGQPDGQPKSNLPFPFPFPFPSPSPSPSPSPNNVPLRASGEGSYHPDSRAALHLLNEASRKSFREIDANLKFISARLSEPGVTLDGVREMIERQAKIWLGTDMEKYLRPETLFNATKFDSYYADRTRPIIQAPQRGPVPSHLNPNHRNFGIVGAEDTGKAARVLARRAAAQAAAKKNAAEKSVASQVDRHGGDTPGHPGTGG